MAASSHAGPEKPGGLPAILHKLSGVAAATPPVGGSKIPHHIPSVMAATAGQIPSPAQPRQLGLDPGRPGLELQGELFVVPTPGPPTRPSRALAAGTTSAPEDPEDAPPANEALAAEAQRRPRQRPPAPEADTETEVFSAEAGAEALEQERAGAREEHNDPTDLPRWHHHSLVDASLLPPVLRHYVELKAAHPDRVLLYRLGDFFEFFFEDAILLSRLLELTLTGKDAGRAVGRVPMAGIPHHAAERYCNDLLRRGLCVALCDQLETTPAKGALLRRDITRVLTPGTVLEEGMLSARRNNWLCAVVLEGEHWGLAVADVSTGEFRLTERRSVAKRPTPPAPPGARRGCGSPGWPAPPSRRRRRQRG